MKKIKLFLCLVFGILLGIGFSIGFYFLVDGQVAWKNYLEEKLIPSATACVSSLLLIWLGITPILKKILNAISLFNNATENVNAVAEKGEKTCINLEVFKDELSQKFTNAVEVGVGKIKEQDERLKRIENHSANTEKITRIGFGNMEELVTRGYAAEIAKVGNYDEET